ncbi:hypothetical protein [Kordia sp.]|uniref:hypothetical protein n=1 Tax=Kordia sp. TaxID=1965332 RepID=UPI003D6B8457
MKLSLQTICISMLLIAVTTEVYSQRETSPHDREFSFLSNNINPLSNYKLPTEATYQSLVANAEGSQFYEETFKKATISNTENVFNVRYNAFLDEMEILDGNDIALIDKEYQKHLISFLDGNISYKVLWEKHKNAKASLAYFVQLEDNNYLSLYRKDSKKYVPSRKQRANDTGKFQNVRSRFYVEINHSGKAIPLPRTNKEFAALFSDKRAKIVAYMKSEKLKVRKENDLIQLINYINEL